jgi:hypothetical protein
MPPNISWLEEMLPIVLADELLYRTSTVEHCFPVKPMLILHYLREVTARISPTFLYLIPFLQPNQ